MTLTYLFTWGLRAARAANGNLSFNTTSHVTDYRMPRNKSGVTYLISEVSPSDGQGGPSVGTVGKDKKHGKCRHDLRLRVAGHHQPHPQLSDCVWLYFRFTLSFRDVEEMLAMRGVALTYETVRHWCLKFGQTYANGLRRKSPRPGDPWALDEGVLQTNGRPASLWAAVG